MADNPHPEVTGELDQKNRCIRFTVVGGTRTARFKTGEKAAILWSANSPCPPWAQQAVREWTETRAGKAAYKKLAELRGLSASPDEIPTEADRPREG